MSIFSCCVLFYYNVNCTLYVRFTFRFAALWTYQGHCTIIIYQSWKFGLELRIWRGLCYWFGAMCIKNEFSELFSVSIIYYVKILKKKLFFFGSSICWELTIFLFEEMNMTLSRVTEIYGILMTKTHRSKLNPMVDNAGYWWIVILIQQLLCICLSSIFFYTCSSVTELYGTLYFLLFFCLGSLLLLSSLSHSMRCILFLLDDWYC